jgi:major vault protein
MADASVIRIKPYQYIHVLDNNTNVTRVEVGPQTFTRQEHEKIVQGLETMVMIPPRHYCIIANPVMRSADGVPVADEHGNIKLRHGDEEIRFDNEPFPLYPGEKLFGKVSPLLIVAPSSALRLRAIRDFTDTVSKTKRVAGDEWLFRGPGTYEPRIEVRVEEIVRATIIAPNQAIKLRAKKQCVDAAGRVRKAGEEWLYREQGAYLADVDEEIVCVLNAHILTERKALHLRATRTYTDINGNDRKAGEEWLVTSLQSTAYIVDVYEELVGEPRLTTLSSRQYCVVLDPFGSDNKQRLGHRVVRKGPLSFFLRPGEKLEAGIQNVHVLSEEEALLLRAKEEFKDGEVVHYPGDRWMVQGPVEYVPPVEVEILETRRSIPLDTNEGIYVRDIRTGKVRSVLGQSYRLSPYEELWQKELPAIVEDLLRRDDPTAAVRDKTRVVTYRAPHNTAVQIYDYKNKSSRVVFGPQLITLGPDEDLTVLSLSGGKPKAPHVVKAVALMLGPDFMTDVVTVETSDHARLSLTLSYNWFFELPEDEEARQAAGAKKLFQVPDFVGDACKAIAARVRGAVASESFDAFHKNSARIIRVAVFGLGDDEKVRNRFQFTANNLVITNIDIQSVEPVDQRTRDSLQKSVQLAIEITTKSQEAAARHEAERLEQEARGRLERQKITDEALAEKNRRALLELQALSASVDSTGQAIAEAKARAKAAQIEGESNVELARLRAEASNIRATSELELKNARDAAELKHAELRDKLELSRAASLANIESEKFKSQVNAIGPATIVKIATSGEETKVKLLKALNLKSVLLTDGNSPINLMGAASGLIAQQ